VDPRRRQELTRYGAPAAFLAAVTIAVILIKSGLDTSSTSQQTTSVASSTHGRTTTQTTTKLVITGPTGTPSTGTTSTTTTTVPGAQYYVVKTGDTLGAIAAKYHTTVEQLLRINPGVDPTKLRPGDQIRVG
jgi:LysM repeat protein